MCNHNGQTSVLNNTYPFCMIRNYITVAFRAILRNKLTAFINIAGLALAMTCALLIYLFIRNEVSYEQYHSHADRIYRVTRSFHSEEGEVSLHLSSVAPPIGPLLKNDFGEMEQVARTLNSTMIIALEENGETRMTHAEKKAFFAEPGIFKIFDITTLSGDPDKALLRPNTVMLSRATALRYFNSTDVIGRRLRADNTADLEVTGVYADFPDEAHWHPEFLVAFSTLEDDAVYGRKQLETNWGNNAFGTYILLHAGTVPSNLEKQFPAFLDKHFGTYARANWGAKPDWVASRTTTLYLQKLTDIHLRSHLDDEVEVNGNINNVYMMGAIGVFIVLIACFNFINLSTARATKRAKEVGLRKVAGAFRNQLIVQYLSESVLLTFLALGTALLLAVPGLEWLNAFTQKNIALNLFQDLPLLGSLLALGVILGILAGIYPALVVSAFKPALTLKGQQGSVKGKSTLRHILVTAQFAISIVLIIATMITFQQLEYLNTRNLGYNKDQVVTLRYYGGELKDNYESFYNELQKTSLIKDVARSSRRPTDRLLDSYGDPKIMKGDSLVSVSMNLKTVAVDESFFDTYAIPVVAGRNFSRAITTDDSLAFIINEAAARELGWAEPGDAIDKDFVYADIRGKLIGVVKDFHFESLHQKIVPMIFLAQRRYRVLSIKIPGNEMQAGLEHIEKVWKEFLPGQPFDYNFLSDRYSQLYAAEQKQNQLFTTFAALAIFIASLGLLGLAAFNTLQRVKEIGIRKVLGASVPGILTLLSREILFLILAANLIAWPAAWYLMNQWLNTFAYHISMSPLTYALAAVAAITVALVTVSTQTIRAAMRNPASTLRHE